MMAVCEPFIATEWAQKQTCARWIRSTSIGESRLSLRFRPAQDASEIGGRAEIVFDRPMRTTFTYLIPKNWSTKSRSANVVLAPFGKGNRRTIGFCVGVDLSKLNAVDATKALGTLKTITEIVDAVPLVSGQHAAYHPLDCQSLLLRLGSGAGSDCPKSIKDKSSGKMGDGRELCFFGERTRTDLPEKFPRKQRIVLETLAMLNKPFPCANLARPPNAR